MLTNTLALRHQRSVRDRQLQLVRHERPAHRPLQELDLCRRVVGDAERPHFASDVRTLTVAPGELTGNVQYGNSDCLNGGVLRVADGYRFVEAIPSHHTIVVPGDVLRRLQLVSAVMGLMIERI